MIDKLTDANIESEQIFCVSFYIMIDLAGWTLTLKLEVEYSNFLLIIYEMSYIFENYESLVM